MIDLAALLQLALSVLTGWRTPNLTADYGQLAAHDDNLKFLEIRRSEQ